MIYEVTSRLLVELQNNLELDGGDSNVLYALILRSNPDLKSKSDNSKLSANICYHDW